LRVLGLYAFFARVCKSLIFMGLGVFYRDTEFVIRLGVEAAGY